MPEIGEVRRGEQIGLARGYKFIWSACIDCKKERWSSLIKGQASHKRCTSCKGVGGLCYRWKGGMVKTVCQECCRIFSIKPYRLEKGKGKFCSMACRARYLRRHRHFNLKPNKPEQTLIYLFEQNKVPFKYVGSGEVWLGNRNPDFINTNGTKQVIELLGTYWHSVFDGADRVEHYKQYGFDCLVIWDDELANLNRVLNKIKKFTRSRRDAITEGHR